VDFISTELIVTLEANCEKSRFGQFGDLAKSGDVCFRVETVESQCLEITLF